MTVRTVQDSMGTMQVPSSALYGAQTARAIANFPISGRAMPRNFIEALALIKAACSRANAQLGLLPADIAASIEHAALAVASGTHDDQFPVDIFQTGSGTSSNMNANEVIASLASAHLGRAVHPNDHVNAAQSSNDSIPTAIAISASLAVERELLPALEHLQSSIDQRARELDDVIKTGRTHLMDAMPISFGQELDAWNAQLTQAQQRIAAALTRLKQLPQGGTAVGTGVNCPPDFPAKFIAEINALSGSEFSSMPNKFLGLSSQDNPVELSAQLKGLAVALMKIANDLRWMNSGPLAGIGDIALPALQPGSSIMPGKVNPVIPEALAMVCAQVQGYDLSVSIAGQSGNFQLNVMLPLIVANLLESCALLSSGMRTLADKAISGFVVNTDAVTQSLAKNPILITALNARIGYEQGAAIAKQAYAEGRALLDVAVEQTDISRSELAQLLDPAALTKQC